MMEQSRGVDRERWRDMLQLLERPAQFGNETGQLANGIFEPGSYLLESLRDSPILVIGAGGLGCELLKDLALSGFCNIHVIDLDSIDVSNLNRQFLFRKKDVGRPKATVAAEVISQRVAGCVVKPYQDKIQNFDRSFYKQFKLIIAGLDNIEARRWMNSLLVGMVEYDEDGDLNPETVIPLIDGGTEGFKGQARLILPRITSCFECTIELFPPQKTYPLCTLAETPRLPEHCITYITQIVWAQQFPAKKMDSDDPAHMQWVFEAALQRAQTYGIQGVTYFKTIGVVKNIIPAVASTNAIVSAACVNEAVKLLTFAGQSLNTYLMYMGTDGLYCNTWECAKKESCVVCGSATTTPLSVSSGITVAALLQKLNDDFQLSKASVMGGSGAIYMRNPPALEMALRSNLDKCLRDVVSSGDAISVVDPALCGKTITMKVVFSDA